LLVDLFPDSRILVGDPLLLQSDVDLVIAFDCVHEHPEPARLLDAVNRVLRPGGRFLCRELAGSSDLADNVDHPRGPLIYTVSTLHCLPVSRAAGGFGPGAMW